MAYKFHPDIASAQVHNSYHRMPARPTLSDICTVLVPLSCSHNPTALATLLLLEFTIAQLLSPLNGWTNFSISLLSRAGQDSVNVLAMQIGEDHIMS